MFLESNDKLEAYPTLNQQTPSGGRDRTIVAIVKLRASRGESNLLLLSLRSIWTSPDGGELRSVA